MTMLMTRMRAGLRSLQPREFRAVPGRCTFCGPALLLRMYRQETGIRCLRCAASAVHLSMGWALASRVVDLGEQECYELSSRGGVIEYLLPSDRRIPWSAGRPVDCAHKAV